MIEASNYPAAYIIGERRNARQSAYVHHKLQGAVKLPSLERDCRGKEEAFNAPWVGRIRGADDPEYMLQLADP